MKKTIIFILNNKVNKIVVNSMQDRILLKLESHIFSGRDKMDDHQQNWWSSIFYCTRGIMRAISYSKTASILLSSW